MERFRMRIGDVEARTCDKHLTRVGGIETIEIIKWDNERCYTVAYFIRQEEGFDLKFVGSRPFHLNMERFWEVAKTAQAFLDVSWNSIFKGQ